MSSHGPVSGPSFEAPQQWAPPGAPDSVPSDPSAPWLPPDTFAAPETPPPPPPDPSTSTINAGRWKLLVGVLLCCLAVLVFTGGFQFARATPRYEQAPMGMGYQRGGTSVRVVSVVATKEIRSSTSAKSEVAPAGSVYVVVRVEVRGTGDPFLCAGTLVLVDGRIYPETFLLSKPDPGACLELGKKPVIQANLYYLVPEESVGSIAGLAVDQRIGLTRTTVLRPPA